MNYHVEWYVIDRDGRTGRMTLRFDAPTSFIAAENTTMVPIMGLIEPLTDGTLFRYRGVWADSLTPASPAPPGINLQSRVLFVIRTINDDYYGFTIPAPKTSIFEETGDYAGIRVKDSIIQQVASFFAAFPLSDPLSPGVPLEIADIVGMREG